MGKVSLGNRTSWLASSALLVAALVPLLILGGRSGADRPRHEPRQRRAAVTQRRANTTGASQAITLAIEPQRHGAHFEQGAIGMSIETKELGTQDLSVSHGSLAALMRLLGPGVLRVGGSSVDSSWWTGNDEPPPSWATNVVTPADLTRLHALLLATGWRVILGVDLGHFDPSRAASEAASATGILGSSLVGFEIGNEPNNYGTAVVRLRARGYNVGNYLNEIASYGAAMRAAVPAVQLYGPDLGVSQAQTWLQPIAANSGAAFSSIDLHYYPVKYSYARGACAATPAPTADQLLLPAVREGEDAALKVMLEAGGLAHRGVRISETNNTSSCDAPGGPATSPVFASALWSLDWALRAASAGVVGLNFHGNFGRCLPESFTPICEQKFAHAASERLLARPEYYGLLAARQLEGGWFVPTRLTASGPLPDITSWATVGRRGVVRVAIENFASTGPPRPVSIRVSGYSASYDVLAAPSIETTTGVKLGGASVTQAGGWRSRDASLSCRRHSCNLAVAPASAVLVTLRPKRSKRSGR